MSKNLKVLIVAPAYPYPPDDGHKLRNYNLFRQFSSGFTFEMLCFGNHATHRDRRSLALNLGSCFESVTLIPPDTKRKILLQGFFTRLKNILFPMDLTVGMDGGYAQEMEFAVNNKISSLAYDLIYFSGFSMFLYYKGDCCQNRFIVDVIDSLALYQKSYFNQHKSIYSMINYLWAKRYEAIHFPRAKNMIFVSSLDKDCAAPKCPNSRIWVVPNGTDSEYYEAKNEGTSSGNALLFTGVMNYPPNNDSAIHFIKSILPLIKKKIPDVTLTIAGKDPTAELRSATGCASDIKLTGFVNDMRPFFDASAVYIAPIIAGSGLKNKILEAWAMSKPVVATTRACYGLAVVDGENVLIADTPQVFAEKTVALLKDSELRMKLAGNGRKTVERCYSWKTQGERLNEIFNELLRE